jgi:hypothetical protein
VLGEDLRKLIGSRYTRGQEICRIGELERFLLKIDVSERDIAQVRLDSPVRFKLKTVPGRTFTGRVSKINAEGIPNQYGQRFYPVEVLVENGDGLLPRTMDHGQLTTDQVFISFSCQCHDQRLKGRAWETAWGWDPPGRAALLFLYQLCPRILRIRQPLYLLD